MSPRQNTVAAIQGSFAGRDELVARAFRDNRSFRELCEHYLQCVATLEHWQRLQTPGASQRQQEYAELRDDLGREIETWLEAMQSGESSSSEGPT